ncbi:MAG TPA: hypothetical protein VL133_16270 [Devosia sp.]|nr:hypothetical protein [Devosia sp.]
MRRPLVALLGVVGAMLLPAAAQAQQRVMIDDAMRAAARSFARAKPGLDAISMGVSSAEYGAALSQRRFQSSLWGRVLAVEVAVKDSGRGLCAGFAAYVTPAIEQGAVALALCPQFFSPGADALRETTMLHEMVHVVAGPDECRAMAYTAQIQMLASGAFQPVGPYWVRHKCDASGYRLPR